MISEWRTAKLVQIAANRRWALNGGPFGSKLSRKHYCESGVPVIRGINLPEGCKFSFDDFVFVTEETADELQANNAHPGDLIFTQRGTIGQVGLIPISSPFHRFLISQSQMKLTVDPAVADALFLYYFFTARDTVQKMKDLSFAAGVPHINLDILRNFEVTLPPLPVQHRIASILSAYDELIENSQRRIRILEEMARALYREWFVHFRFPGHENHLRVHSRLGEIPDGWAVKKFGEVANITMGLSPKGNTYNEVGDGTPLINGPVEFGERFAKQVKWTTAPTKVCKEGDLVVCVRGATTGKHVKSDGTYCLGRGVCGISGEYQSFVSLLFENELSTLLGQTSGSTFPSWTGPQLKSHPVLLPPPDLLSQIEALLKPLIDAVFVYSRRIDNLRRTRDLLLPRLLSGTLQLDVV